MKKFEEKVVLFLRLRSVAGCVLTFSAHIFADFTAFRRSFETIRTTEVFYIRIGRWLTTGKSRKKEIRTGERVTIDNSFVFVHEIFVLVNVMSAK